MQAFRRDRRKLACCTKLVHTARGTARSSYRPHPDMNIRSEISRTSAALRRPIYLDHHATTPVDRRVAATMMHVMTEQFGNPNDRSHQYGQEAFRLVEDSRAAIAALFNADAEDVSFASSATTAADRLFRRLAEGSAGQPLRVAVTTVEHGGILDALGRLERAGTCEIRWIDVDEKARPEIGRIEEALAKGCDLLVVMAANNEVGTINPIENVSRLAREHGVPLFVDASQAAAHIPIDAYDLQITYLLISAHKMYGPKGISALVSGTDGSRILRHIEAEGGTPNVAAIAGFAEACRICAAEMPTAPRRIEGLRNHLEQLLIGGIPGLVRNGDVENRLPQNLHVSVTDVPNEAVVARLSRLVAVSTGSACRSGTDVPSHVLRAMGLSQQIVDGALRMGLGRDTTADDVERASTYMCEVVDQLRRTRNEVR